MQLNGLGAVVPTSAEFWGAPKYPDTFTPVNVVNMGSKAPVSGGWLATPLLPGVGMVENGAINKYTFTAFMHGTRGTYSPLPVPVKDPATPDSMLAPNSVFNADPAQWRDLYDYVYQRGVETAAAYPNNVYYAQTELYAIVNIAGPHPVVRVIDDYALQQYKAGKNLVFVGSNPNTLFGNISMTAFQRLYDPSLTADQISDKSVQEMVAQLSKLGESGGDGLSDAISGLVSNVVSSVVSVVKAPIAIVTGQESLTLSNIAQIGTAPLGLATTAGVGGADVTQKVGNIIGAGAVIGTGLYVAAGGFTGTAIEQTATSAATTVSTTVSTAKNVAGAISTAEKLLNPQTTDTGALTAAVSLQPVKTSLLQNPVFLLSLAALLLL